MCILFIYTISFSIFCVSQEETTLIASNQQINDFYKSMWKINFTSQHCGKRIVISELFIQYNKDSCYNILIWLYVSLHFVCQSPFEKGV